LLRRLLGHPQLLDRLFQLLQQGVPLLAGCGELLLDGRGGLGRRPLRRHRLELTVQTLALGGQLRLTRLELTDLLLDAGEPLLNHPQVLVAFGEMRLLVGQFLSGHFEELFFFVELPLEMAALLQEQPEFLFEFLEPLGIGDRAVLAGFPFGFQRPLGLAHLIDLRAQGIHGVVDRFDFTLQPGDLGLRVLLGFLGHGDVVGQAALLAQGGLELLVQTAAFLLDALERRLQALDGGLRLLLLLADTREGLPQRGPLLLGILDLALQARFGLHGALDLLFHERDLGFEVLPRCVDGVDLALQRLLLGLHLPAQFGGFVSRPLDLLELVLQDREARFLPLLHTLHLDQDLAGAGDIAADLVREVRRFFTDQAQ